MSEGGSPTTSQEISPAVSCRARRSWWCLWIVASFWLVLAIVPFDARIPAGNDPDIVDHSWMLALHVARAEHLHFGSDIQFTYGPLGFVLAPVYYRPTFAALLAGRILLAGAMLIGAASIAVRRIRHPLVAAGWLGLIVLLTATWRSNFNEDPIPVLLAIAALTLHFELDRRAVVAVCLCMIALSLLSLSKSSYIPLTLVVIGAVVLDDLLHRRIVAAACAMGLCICAVIIGWTLIGQQSAAQVIPYLRSTRDVVSGYSDAMTYADPRAAVTAIYAAMWIAFVALVATGRGDAARWSRRIMIVAIAGVAFLIFKAGIIRIDREHLASCTAALLVAILMYGAAAFHRVLPRRRRWLALTGAAAVLFVGLVGGKTGRGVVTYPGRMVRETLHGARAAVALAANGTSALSAEQERATASLRDIAPPQSRGVSVEVYPNDIALAVALSDHPLIRPALQSYQAYTKVLAQADADFLSAAAAPDKILFKVDPINDRYPSLDDSLSWPMFLSRYEPVSVAHDYVLLRRRAASLATKLTPIAARDGVLGQWVDVDLPPPLLWATIDVPRKPQGALQNALLRPASLSMSVRRNDGKESTYRLIPRLASAGFLLSPLIDNAAAFDQLARDEGRTSANLSRVSAIKLDSMGDMGDFSFKLQWTLRLYDLHVGPAFSAAAPGEASQRPPALSTNRS